MSEQRLRINAENVVHEEVDGEVIAIDLSGGSYYSLSGGAPPIWAILAEGAGVEEICASLAARYDVGADELRDQVSELLAKLRENNLVVAADGEAPTGSSQPPVEGGGAFPAPVFERYNDMKDYFLLDPIHEVDSTGWPKPAA